MRNRHWLRSVVRRNNGIGGHVSQSHERWAGYDVPRPRHGWGWFKAQPDPSGSNFHHCTMAGACFGRKSVVEECGQAVDVELGFRAISVHSIWHYRTKP